MSIKPEKKKCYAKMGYTEEEFQLVRSSVQQSRKTVFECWTVATNEKEKAFYAERITQYDALLSRYDAVLRADTSQDASPADYPEED